jgi:hypothetical protein
MEAFNETRVDVWRRQGEAFLAATFSEEAIIDVDGAMVTATGECKQGESLFYPQAEF